MIHEIQEGALIADGISIERSTPTAPRDYVAVYLRVPGQPVVRFLAWHYPGQSIEWSAAKLSLNGYSTIWLYADQLQCLPDNYYSDDPAPVWATP